MPEFLKTIAPTLVGLLGTPALGIATKALIDAFDGDEDKANSVINAKEGDVFSDESLTKIKLAEIAAKARADELGIDLARIDADDRKSAREREMSVKDWTPKLLAAVVTIGYFGVLSYMLQYGVPEKGGDALLVMLGALGGGWTTILAYYYGSSSSSAAKNELLLKAKQ
jgi:hypothetical protein